jgi:hemoglobin
MMSRHLGLNITEQQRIRWVETMFKSADKAGFPTDPEFLSAFVAYMEWGIRIALIMSQPGK